MTEPNYEKPLPCNLEAERLVMGCIILAKQQSVMISDAAKIISSDDFFLPSHRLLYAALLSLHEAGHQIDPVTLSDKLRIDGRLEQVGGPAYIASLLDGVPRFSDITNYCRIVKRCSAMRQYISGAALIMQMGFEDNESPEVIKQRAKQLLLGIDSLGGTQQSEWTADLLEGALNRQASNGSLATGFYELDKLLRGGGLAPGDFFVIAARTSKGKSTLAMQIAGNVCDRYDSPKVSTPPVSLYVSLESDNEDVVDRLLGMRAQLSFSSLQQGALTPDENQRRKHWLNRMANWRLAICDQARMSIADVVREAEIIKRQEGRLDLVAVDYLGLMNSQSNSKERLAQIESLTRDIKIAASELACPFIVPVQLNRLGLKESRKYRLDDLRSSGSIEQDATKVLILQDPLYGQLEEGYTIDAWLAKQRKGVVGTLNLFFNGSYGAFGEVHGSGKRGLPADEKPMSVKQQAKKQSAPLPPSYIDKDTTVEDFTEEF